MSDLFCLFCEMSSSRRRQLSSQISTDDKLSLDTARFIVCMENGAKASEFVDKMKSCKDAET